MKNQRMVRYRTFQLRPGQRVLDRGHGGEACEGERGRDARGRDEDPDGRPGSEAFDQAAHDVRRHHAGDRGEGIPDRAHRAHVLARDVEVVCPET